MWVHGKDVDADRLSPLPGLILIAQPSIEDVEKDKQARRVRAKARRAESRHGRVKRFIETCAAGTTVEEVADQTETNCKLVREIVQEMKDNGELIEAAHRSHALIRIRFEGKET